MARSRIATLGASCLLVLAAMLDGAEAQTAGSPLPLLQIDHAKTAVHAQHKAARRLVRTKSAEKTAHRHIAKHAAKRVHAKTQVADAARDLPASPATPPQATPPQTTPPHDAQNIWSAPAAVVAGNIAVPSGSSLPSGVTPVTPAVAPAATVVTESVVDTDPNSILNGRHAVPAAMPNLPKPAASAPKPQPAAARPTSTSPSSTVAAAAPLAAKPAVHAMLVKPSAPSHVGSASWIAQILAALGGAIAAGAVAWLLIRPAPERTYG